MIPEPAIEAVAKYLADEASDWVDLDDHDHTLECTNWEAYTVEAWLALQAALPHIEAALRRQIANDIRTKGDWVAHMYYAEGREDAARIAEKGIQK